MGIESGEEKSDQILTTVGWREWVYLPELSDLAVKAKVDSGAKTSALHAYFIEPYSNGGAPFIKFLIHPKQHDLMTTRECHAAVLDQREVSDSGGHREIRYVIASTFVLGDQSFTAELTLTDRDSMLFRMLLGRNALRKRYIIDSGRSFLMGGSVDKPPDFAMGQAATIKL